MRGREKYDTNGAVEMIDKWIRVQIGRKVELGRGTRSTKRKVCLLKNTTLKLCRLTKRYNDRAGDAVGHTD